MNKYIVTLLFMLTCLLTACGYRDYLYRNMADASGQAVSGGGTDMQKRSKEKSTADTGTAISGSGIHSADNVTADMQTVDFWIGKTIAPDKILMTKKEIEAFNKKMLAKLSADSSASYYDLSKYGESIDGASLRAMIKKEHDPAKRYFTGNAEITEDQWEAYRQACNLDAIADFNAIQYGMICSRADVRILPTMDNITDVQGDTGHDIMQRTALAVNEPVLVVHRSLDGKWVYVIANEHSGWVLQDKVGICQSKEIWQDAQKMEDFIVVTGDEVSVKTVFSDTLSGDQIFTMGTRLAIAKESEYSEELKQKKVYDNYIVKIPVRDADGQLIYQLAAIPLGKDVSYGYLDYTRGNVLRQAFKLLGNPYGWGGMEGGRDCSSMTRDIYLCFGFRLPRDASAQAMIPGKGRVTLKGLSEKERKEKLNSIQPGTILQMPGHVMIYLGCYGQKHYVISANGTFMPDSKAGIDSSDQNYQTRLVTVNDLGVRSPSNGKTWQEQLAVIIGIP